MVRSTYGNIQTPRVGKPLTRSWVTNVTDKLNAIDETKKSTPRYTNPLLISVKNMTGLELPLYSIMRITDAVCAQEQIQTLSLFGFLGHIPYGNDNEEIVITTTVAFPTNTVSCVIQGPTPVKILFPDEASLGYHFAIPIENDVTQLKASPFGKIQILWHESPPDEMSENGLSLNSWVLLGARNEALFFKLNEDLVSKSTAIGVIVNELGEELGDGIEKTIYAPIGAEGSNHTWRKNSIVRAQWEPYLEKWVIPTTDYSEMFGTLSSDFSYGDEFALITLNEGFSIYGETELEAKPAPTIGEDLTAGTPVTCRYIMAKGEWFFFRPSGSASETRILTISGGTLEGFYADELGDSDYEPQAKKISIFSTLSEVACMATREDVNAVGSDTEENWIQFINQAVDGVDDCEFTPNFIRGDYAQYSYGTSNRIFLRSDCNWQKVSSEETLPMLQFIGNHYYGSVYSESNFDGTVRNYVEDNCLYRDINNQTGYGILGEIHSQENIDLGATYSQRENKPCYLFNEDSQMYEGINGAEGSFQFGRPEWRLFDSEQNRISEFIRSWKRTENGWTYEGVFDCWLHNVDSEYLHFSYRNMQIETAGNISYLRLGTQNRENQGWFETILNTNEMKKDGDNIGDVIVESQMFTLSFTVTPRENIEVSAWDILTDSIEQGIGKIREDSTSTENGLIFYIKETDVTRWEIEKSETDEISVTFQFVPGSETEEEPKPDKVYTISQIIQKDYDADGEPHFTGNEFTIGTYGDSAGYWKCDEMTLEEISVVFQFTPLEQDDLTLEFYQMNTQPKKEKIWVFVPQVLTD